MRVLCNNIDDLPSVRQIMEEEKQMLTSLGERFVPMFVRAELEPGEHVDHLDTVTIWSGDVSWIGTVMAVGIQAPSQDKRSLVPAVDILLCLQYGGEEGGRITERRVEGRITELRLEGRFAKRRPPVGAVGRRNPRATVDPQAEEFARQAEEFARLVN